MNVAPKTGYIKKLHVGQMRAQIYSILPLYGKITR